MTRIAKLMPPNGYLVAHNVYTGWRWYRVGGGDRNTVIDKQASHVEYASHDDAVLAARCDARWRERHVG